MVGLVVVKVSIVVLAGLIVGDGVVRSDEAALEVLLTVSDGQGELSCYDWQRTLPNVLLYPTGLLQVGLPSCWVSWLDSAHNALGFFTLTHLQGSQSIGSGEHQ